jgi:hypothetical protein
MKVWALGKNAGKRILTYHCIDFAAAGQDAISVVFYLCTYSQKRHEQQCLQIGVFPRPGCSLHLADATAIKVRPLHSISSQVITGL